MTRMRLAIRDPAVWGLAVSAACGFGDIRPWAIVALTLLLTMLILQYGSRLVWQLLLSTSRPLSWSEQIAVTFVASFCVTVLGYIGGDLLEHVALRSI